MTLSAVELGEMRWEYPGAKHPYILRAGGSEVGRLQFVEGPHGKSWGEMQGRRWTFVHTAGRHMHIGIFRGDSDEAVAEFVRDFGGGVLTFASGAKYTWRKRGLRPGRWCFRCEADRSAVCVSQQSGPLIEGARVTVCRDVAAKPETPVLLLLAWYLRILDAEAELESMYVPV